MAHAQVSSRSPLDRRTFLRHGTALARALTGAATPAVRAQQPRENRPVNPAGDGRRPNILFLLADNVGYGVPSCYNGGIADTPTPRIDRLAAKGLRLTNFNVENQCTPSRAAGTSSGRTPGSARRSRPSWWPNQASGKKFPNLAPGQPNDRPPVYGKEDPAAPTGAEAADPRLRALKEH